MSRTSTTTLTQLQTEAHAEPGGGAEQPHGIPVSGMWRVVARREIVTKVTDKSFLIGTLITLAIMAAFFGYQVISSDRVQTYQVAAAPTAQAMADRLHSELPRLDDKARVEVVPVPSDAAARDRVHQDGADVALTGSADGWVLTAKTEVPSALERHAPSVVRQAALQANAASAGVSMAALERGATLHTGIIDGNADQQTFARAMGFALAFLFYISAIGFGFTLAGSVVEEKANRIVEIIATKIPLRQLLAGKILGNSVLAFGQLALYSVVGLVGLGFTSYSSYLPQVTGTLVWYLGFFVVGFLLLSCVWAVVGALASRQEDLQQTASPVMFLVMAVFFSSFLASGVWQTVLSFVPPFSAVLMPIRILAGTAAWWEPVVAMAVLLVSAVVVVLLAERLYRRALLQSHGRLTVRQAWATAE